MKRKTYTTLAAIHLGSEMLRLRIVEYRSLSRIKVIEQCEYPIRLGEEAFKNKSIPFSMVEEICQVLQGFKELMQEYGTDVYTAQATTAVREASNKVFMLDQIKLRTGLDVTVTEMPMEIYTKYVAIRKTVRDQHISSEKGIMLLDISSGGLGVTLLQDEQIKFQENFHIGIIRIKEAQQPAFQQSADAVPVQHHGAGAQGAGRTSGQISGAFRNGNGTALKGDGNPQQE